MKYEDIRYYERRGTDKPGRGLHLPGGYWVQESLFCLMWRRAIETLPNIDWSKKQTVVTIFGDAELWVSQKFGVRIALGRCLKYFADHDMLPIRVANVGKKGPRKYVRA